VAGDYETTWESDPVVISSLVLVDWLLVEFFALVNLDAFLSHQELKPETK
jgi:hypothetical protein